MPVQMRPGRAAVQAAKCQLMAWGMAEREAYQALRKASMARRVKMEVIAAEVLALARQENSGNGTGAARGTNQ